MIRPHGPNCWTGLGAFSDRVLLKHKMWEKPHQSGVKYSLWTGLGRRAVDRWTIGGVHERRVIALTGPRRPSRQRCLRRPIRQRRRPRSPRHRRRRPGRTRPRPCRRRRSWRRATVTRSRRSAEGRLVCSHRVPDGGGGCDERARREPEIRRFPLSAGGAFKGAKRTVERRDERLLLLLLLIFVLFLRRQCTVAMVTIDKPVTGVDRVGGGVVVDSGPKIR